VSYHERVRVNADRKSDSTHLVDDDGEFCSLNAAVVAGVSITRAAMSVVDATYCQCVNSANDDVTDVLERRCGAGDFLSRTPEQRTLWQENKHPGGARARVCSTAATEPVMQNATAKQWNDFSSKPLDKSQSERAVEKGTTNLAVPAEEWSYLDAVVFGLDPYDPAPGGIGVDTVKLFIPIDEDSKHWRNCDLPTVLRFPQDGVPGDGVEIKIDYPHHSCAGRNYHGLVCKIKFSLPHVVRWLIRQGWFAHLTGYEADALVDIDRFPQNIFPCGPQAMREVADYLQQLLDEYGLNLNIRAATMSRVDLFANRFLQHPTAGYRRVMRNLLPPHMQVILHRDSHNTTSRNRSRSCCFYNKGGSIRAGSSDTEQWNRLHRLELRAMNARTHRNQVSAVLKQMSTQERALYRVMTNADIGTFGWLLDHPQIAALLFRDRATQVFCVDSQEMRARCSTAKQATIPTTDKPGHGKQARCRAQQPPFDRVLGRFACWLNTHGGQVTGDDLRLCLKRGGLECLRRAVRSVSIPQGKKESNYRSNMLRKVRDLYWLVEYQTESHLARCYDELCEVFLSTAALTPSSNAGTGMLPATCEQADKSQKKAAPAGATESQQIGVAPAATSGLVKSGICDWIVAAISEQIFTYVVPEWVFHAQTTTTTPLITVIKSIQPDCHSIQGQLLHGKRRATGVRHWHGRCKSQSEKSRRRHSRVDAWLQAWGSRITPFKQRQRRGGSSIHRRNSSRRRRGPVRCGIRLVAALNDP
jgi:hypothetical protein